MSWTLTTPDGTFYRDDLARDDSATADWLTRFRDFCRTATDGVTAGSAGPLAPLPIRA